MSGHQQLREDLAAIKADLERQCRCAGVSHELAELLATFTELVELALDQLAEE